MSDDEQGAIPPEDEQTPSEPEAGATDADAGAPAEPQAEGDASPPETPDAEAGAEPEINADAAAALAAAQAAVADALKEDLADGDPTAVASAQETAEATGEDLEAMMAAAIEAEKAEQAGAAGGDAQPFSMPEFSPAGLPPDSAEMQLLGDVNVDVRIELGRTRMLVEDVLRLGSGAVVELEKLAGDPVDVFVNGRHVARGEVLVLNESFCVRVNEVLEPVTIESAGD